MNDTQESAVDEPVKLNLGCGREILEGWVNLDHHMDWAAPGEIVVCDICYGLPFHENTVSHIRAMDIIEHIPPWRMTKVDLMNELYRVMIPDGVLEIRTPHPDAHGPWSDPTHYTVWVEQSFDYFSGEHGAKYMLGLGIKAQFEKTTIRRDDLNIHVKLRAIKPSIQETYLQEQKGGLLKPPSGS